jgi:hypothetical protein
MHSYSPLWYHILDRGGVHKRLPTNGRKSLGPPVSGLHISKDMFIIFWLCFCALQFDSCVKFLYVSLSSIYWLCSLDYSSYEMHHIMFCIIALVWLCISLFVLWEWSITMFNHLFLVNLGVRALKSMCLLTSTHAPSTTCRSKGPPQQRIFSLLRLKNS